MAANLKKMVVAVTGASGSIYAKVLLDKLAEANGKLEVAVVMSDNAKTVWEHELGNRSWQNYPFRFFEKNDFSAPFASGSTGYQTLIVCPCSMGTLARIAAGTSNDLVTRAADVILKERRRLILVTRETPISGIHISNMQTVTNTGGIICPASPSFYSRPTTLEEAAATVIDRILDLSGIEVKSFRWGENQK